LGVDTLAGFWFLPCVMKNAVRKIILVACLAGFATALITPAQAGRRIIIITTDPVNTLPLVSVP